MTTILVTGSNGQLGSELRVLSEQYTSYDFTFTDRRDIDLNDTVSIEHYFLNKRFDVIINCAAYTSVDKAESEPIFADHINHQAVKTLARIAANASSSLIHISTDYVFNGQNFKPYVETDPTDPQSVYGQSKLAGEKAMLAINPPRSLIIRTSWVYSSFGTNFVKTMLRLGREHASLSVIFDQVGTPTYAKDLAYSILEIIPQLKNHDVELLHFSNEGACSWYDFSKAIFEYAAIECQVNPIESKEYPTPAPRPHYSLLNKAKIKTHYHLEVPYWRDSLALCIKILTDNR